MNSHEHGNLSQSASATDSAAKKIPTRTFRVFVSAPCWHGDFDLPESCFNELTSFLTARMRLKKPHNEDANAI